MPLRRNAALQRGARMSSDPVASTESRKPKSRASQGSTRTSSRTAAASAGSRERRRPVTSASRVIRPHAAARMTLGSGRHTTTKARVSNAPSTAVPRSGMPRRGARPRRSARWALPGGPMSTASMIMRFAPLTASRCVMSVARNAASRSAGSREVSPTTSPGSRPRASPSSPAVASRSPERRPPAVRCSGRRLPDHRRRPVGAAYGPWRRCPVRDRSVWAPRAGRHPQTRRRQQPSHSAVLARSRCWTMTSTGVRTAWSAAGSDPGRGLSGQSAPARCRQSDAAASPVPSHVSPQR